MTIKFHKNKELIDKIDEFERSGGCILFKVFEVENRIDSYQTHLEIAKRTLIEISNDWENYIQKVVRETHTDRGMYFRHENYFEKLESSGIQITIQEFFGPQFDFLTNKPLIKGVKRLYNSYFYYDTIEDEESAIDIKSSGTLYRRGFIGAFLDPPHSIRIGRNVFEHGKYFLDFCKLLFSDIEKIEIYKWSVDSSNYFVTGKEWWGAFFWTIYNPVKNIYIGAVASTTD